jgi:hypothetical protein
MIGVGIVVNAVWAIPNMMGNPILFNEKLLSTFITFHVFSFDVQNYSRTGGWSQVRLAAMRRIRSSTAPSICLHASLSSTILADFQFRHVSTANSCSQIAFVSSFIPLLAAIQRLGGSTRRRERLRAGL